MLCQFLPSVLMDWGCGFGIPDLNAILIRLPSSLHRRAQQRSVMSCGDNALHWGSGPADPSHPTLPDPTPTARDPESRPPTFRGGRRTGGVGPGRDPRPAVTSHPAARRAATDDPASVRPARIVTSQSRKRQVLPHG